MADSPFEPVKDFPSDGDWIASIVAGGPGFVAVGASQPEFPDFNPACKGDIDGRVWTSPDGRKWTKRRIDVREIRLTEVVEFRGLLFAFGRPGARCNMSGDRGWSAWSSPDGVGWTLVASGVGAPYGHVYDVVVSEGRLIALGWNDRRPAVWVSEDGSNWSAASAPQSIATGGAGLGQTVVASTSSDDLVAGLLLALSYDQGEDWQDVWVDLGSYGDFRFSPKFAASNGTLLVATRACCLLPGVELGVPITTADGRTWSMGPTLASPADAVVALPDGFMALNGADGRTQLSPDGNSWFDGPTLRSVEGVYFELAAAGPLGVVIVPTGAGIRARHVRFAPADRLNPGAWTTPAETAEEPQIGEAYPVRLFGPIAQCDRRAYQILMDARAWVPTADAPFRDLDPILEDGTVTMLTEDTAIYENQQGVSVAFEAVHPPPPYINCPY